MIEVLSINRMWLNEKKTKNQNCLGSCKEIFSKLNLSLQVYALWLVIHMVLFTPYAVSGPSAGDGRSAAILLQEQRKPGIIFGSCPTELHEK